MTPEAWIASTMKIRRLWELTKDDRKQLLARAKPDLTRAAKTAEFIIERVRTAGDSALVKWTAEFDGVELTPDQLRVSAEEIDHAAESLPAEIRNAIDLAISNIRTFHQATMPEPVRTVDVGPGVVCTKRYSPIDSVCLYVPHGRGGFSSVLCMAAVPATLAGVPRIIVCTPPGPDRQVDPATLYVARRTGIDEVYRIGGAQAVAAVAFGTETVPACVKIVGPANVYATAAKRLLSDEIDPGPGAGPSEAIILCDDSPNPRNVALNLMTEAEHGEDSCALLVTHHEPLVQAVDEIVSREIPQLTPQRSEFVSHVMNAYGGAVLTRSLDESIAFVNEFAVEHLSIMTRDPRDVAGRVTNAGEILLGDCPIIAIANFMIGVNEILPTSRYARTESPVSVSDFLKASSVVEINREAYERFVGPVAAWCEHGGFTAHRRAAEQWEH
jgi:histidinol dehydrogenase